MLRSFDRQSLEKLLDLIGNQAPFDEKVQEFYAEISRRVRGMLDDDRLAELRGRALALQAEIEHLESKREQELNADLDRVVAKAEDLIGAPLRDGETELNNPAVILSSLSGVVFGHQEAQKLMKVGVFMIPTKPTGGSLSSNMRYIIKGDSLLCGDLDGAADDLSWSSGAVEQSETWQVDGE